MLETQKTILDEEWNNIQRRQNRNRAMEGTEIVGTETELESSKRGDHDRNRGKEEQRTEMEDSELEETEETETEEGRAVMHKLRVESNSGDIQNGSNGTCNDTATDEDIKARGMVTERTVMETCGNITGIETRKGSGAETEVLVTRREVSLADILEIKLGSMGADRVRTVGIVSYTGS